MPMKQHIAILVLAVTCCTRITGAVPSVTVGASVIVPLDHFHPVGKVPAATPDQNAPAVPPAESATFVITGLLTTPTVPAFALVTTGAAVAVHGTTALIVAPAGTPAAV